MTQKNSSPDPSPLGSLSKRDFLRLAPLGLLIGMTGTAQGAHKSSSPFPDGAWGVETIVGHGTSERPSIAELESAWSETYHFLFVDVDSGDRYYAEHGDTSWTALSSGGSGGLYDTVTSVTDDYTISDKEYVLADASSTPIIIDLPSPASHAEYGVKKTDSSVNPVTVQKTDIQPDVDGNQKVELDTQHEAVEIISTSSDYFVVSHAEPDDITYQVATAVVDDFEDQNLTEYSGDTGSFDIQQSTVLEGSWTLRASDNQVGRMVSTTGLPIYPDQGDTYKVQTQLADSGVKGMILWFVQDIDNLYGVQIDDFNSDLQLFVMSGGSFSALANTTFDWALNTEYRIEITSESNGTLTATAFEESSGTEEVTVSATDTSYSDGGIGFRLGSSTNETIYFDHARIG